MPTLLSLRSVRLKLDRRLENGNLSSWDFMEDNYGHLISYLRISITDRCNERCHYCLPQENQEWLPREEVLTYEEILRVARVGAELGISKVRVTGGEPLTRRNVLSFIDELCQIPGIDDVGLSTNGTLLNRKPYPDSPETNAAALKRSGVRTVNISLDTLNQQEYEQTTGRDYLQLAIKGIETAIAEGFEKVKLNSVLMRHKNEHELWDLVNFAQEKGALIRFIELMPVSSSEVLSEDNFLSVGEAKKLIEFKFGALTPLPDFKTNGPASYFQIESTGQIIGFIGAMTNFHFCETCNKLRLTCEGKLRPCLGSHLEFDLREVIRNPEMTDEDLKKFFLQVVARKPEQHDFRDNYQPGRRMIAIGG
ncbi:MAG: GTP 3',8-cyclase MoaA [Verrucomicrobiales bacterium]|nr:GTP 3',8-cyclase MoaA [Verrucomicrobiales bacterium]